MEVNHKVYVHYSTKKGDQFIRSNAKKGKRKADESLKEFADANDADAVIEVKIFTHKSFPYKSVDGAFTEKGIEIKSKTFTKTISLPEDRVTPQKTVLSKRPPQSNGISWWVPAKKKKIEKTKKIENSKDEKAVFLPPIFAGINKKAVEGKKEKKVETEEQKQKREEKKAEKKAFMKRKWKNLKKRKREKKERAKANKRQKTEASGSEAAGSEASAFKKTSSSIIQEITKAQEAKQKVNLKKSSERVENFENNMKKKKFLSRRKKKQIELQRQKAEEEEGEEKKEETANLKKPRERKVRFS